MSKLDDVQLVAAYSRGVDSCPEFQNDQELYGIRAVQDAVLVANPPVSETGRAEGIAFMAAFMKALEGDSGDAEIDAATDMYEWIRGVLGI